MLEHPKNRSIWDLLYTMAGATAASAIQVWSRVSRSQDLRERMGALDPLPADLKPLWFHGASVGELGTVLPLASEVSQRFRGVAWGVTTTTVTGREGAIRQCPDALFHRLLPIDAWPATERFISAIHPGAVIIVETELWPHLIRALAQRKIPICLASARMTARSLRSYKRASGLFRDVLRSMDLISARSEEDRERFIALGAPAERTLVQGNIKLDGLAETQDEARAARIGRLVGDRHLVVWGCLRPGEEALAVEVVQRLRGRATALWVLAPRHLPDFDRTAAALAKAGLPFRRWSDPTPADPATNVLLLDTLGELRDFYACADAAVVGGTFGGFGGHNLMEPAAYGVPVIFGRDTSAWPEDAARLLDVEGGVRVHGPKDLEDAIWRLLSDPESRTRMGAQARAAAEAGRGASRRVVDELVARDFFSAVTSHPEPALR